MSQPKLPSPAYTGSMDKGAGEKYDKLVFINVLNYGLSSW